MRAWSYSSLLILGGGCFSASETKKPDAAPSVDAATDSAPSDSATPDANPAAPTCVVDMPANNANTAFDVPVTLKATATDPQDGTLTGASVVWRSSLQTAPLGSGDMITTTLPPGNNVVTCIATDSTSLTGTGTVMVLSRSPFAQINHPGNNETRSAATAVPFIGIARDLVDGNLTGASLVWTSSLDGALGTGDQFSKTLSVGTHTITLTATDSATKTDAATITLIMN